MHKALFNVPVALNRLLDELNREVDSAIGAGNALKAEEADCEEVRVVPARRVEVISRYSVSPDGAAQALEVVPFELVGSPVN